jgi:polyisoprenoid-binding protein YceI
MATWVLGSDHSSATFAVRHMMVTWVRGIFTKVTGTLTFDPVNVAASAVEVEIAAASLFTGVGQRDDHLKSADFLEVEKYPAITFKSTRVEPVALPRTPGVGRRALSSRTTPPLSFVRRILCP